MGLMKMKNRFGKWFVILIVPLVFVLSCVNLYADKSKRPGEEIKEIVGEVKWHGFDEGVVLGKMKGKKIFVYFWAQWCPFCKKMDKETLKKPSVVSYLNNNFISIKVDSDKERKTASKYFVRGFPTSWFLTKNGEKISSLPGFIPSDMFLRVLKFIHLESYEEMTFGEYLKSK